jgi:hypothetical protein
MTAVEETASELPTDPAAREVMRRVLEREIDEHRNARLSAMTPLTAFFFSLMIGLYVVVFTTRLSSLYAGVLLGLDVALFYAGVWVIMAQVRAPASVPWPEIESALGNERDPEEAYLDALLKAAKRARWLDSRTPLRPWAPWLWFRGAMASSDEVVAAVPADGHVSPAGTQRPQP